MVAQFLPLLVLVFLRYLPFFFSLTEQALSPSIVLTVSFFHFPPPVTASYGRCGLPLTEDRCGRCLFPSPHPPFFLLHPVPLASTCGQRPHRRPSVIHSAPLWCWLFFPLRIARASVSFPPDTTSRPFPPFLFPLPSDSPNNRRRGLRRLFFPLDREKALPPPPYRERLRVQSFVPPPFLYPHVGYSKHIFFSLPKGRINSFLLPPFSVLFFFFL